MISIILIVFIILMVMSRNFDIDLDIKGIESFNPIVMDEEVKKVKEVRVVKVVAEVEEEIIIHKQNKSKGSNKRSCEDYVYMKQFKTKIRSHSKRGDHGHKGYTRVQTLAYKKARAFKISHLNEWC